MLKVDGRGQTPRVAERASEVPFSDLKGQFDLLREELTEAILKVAASGSYVLGAPVAGFETAFAGSAEARHCIGVNSGTSALHLALLAAGVGPGDEVITVPMTFIATCWAISYVGAKPVFVDISPVTYTMDADQVERRITPRTRAILPVHLYGQPADMAALLEIGQRNGIPVIEDAAQAHGAAYAGRPVGTLGRLGCFSFYPGKNLGASGEAGAILTDDDALASRLRSLRDHAQSERYHHSEIGFNYRMDALQGAVLAVKLKYLERWTDRRSMLADRYITRLATFPLQLPIQAPDRKHVWHLFVVLHPERDRLRQQLAARGIQTGLHYPVPVHLQKAYEHLGHQPGDFPVAERVAREGLSLPLYPEMTLRQQDAVIDALTELLAHEHA